MLNLALSFLAVEVKLDGKLCQSQYERACSIDYTVAWERTKCVCLNRQLRIYNAFDITSYGFYL